MKSPWVTILFVLMAGLMAPSIQGGNISSGGYEDALSAYEAGEYVRARRLLEPLARAGDARAQFKLGVLYSEGWGVEQNLDRAIYWYRRSAEAGLPKAQYNLAHVHLTRIMSGRYTEEDVEQALHWFEKAAATGMARATSALGGMYWGGFGVKEDPVRARSYFESAAAMGNARANFALGIIYMYGEGVARDDAMAADYFARAAEAGDTDGIYYLGMLYYEGRGVPKDDARAFELISRAAELGNFRGYFGMYEIYRWGYMGQEVDLKKALFWLRKYCRAQEKVSYAQCMDRHLP